MPIKSSDIKAFGANDVLPPFALTDFLAIIRICCQGGDDFRGLSPPTKIHRQTF